jgi:hypothetical protein
VSSAWDVLERAGQRLALDVGYPEAIVNRALLAGTSPRRVALDSVTDRRTDRTRVGVRPKKRRRDASGGSRPSPTTRPRGGSE